MTVIHSVKFTPELLITAPRRSQVVPNAAGTHGIYSVSTYDLEAHKEYKETRILKIHDASSTLFSSDSKDSDPQWLGDTDLIFHQRSTENEETELWIANGIGEKRSYYAGKIPSSVLELKAAQLKNGDVGVTFSSPTNPKGQMFNPKTADQPKHTGHDYTSHPVRIWDTQNPTYRMSLYYTTISKQSDGRWKLSSDKPINALKGTKIEYPLSPGAVLGECGSYTVGPRGILLCTTNPGQNRALTLVFKAYLIALESFKEQRPVVMTLKSEYTGPAQDPCFSADGNLAAFVICRNEHFMSCERGIAWFHMDDVSSKKDLPVDVNLEKFTDGKETTWDRAPGSLAFNHDNSGLYLEAEDYGSVKLFKMDVGFSRRNSRAVSRLAKAPKCLTTGSSISSAALLSRNNASGSTLIISTSSVTENSLYSILDPSTGKVEAISSNSDHGKDLGLKASQYESITFPGHKSRVQAHIIRPSFFDPKQSYPLALIIHGGPQSAWNNSWSTRWNPALFAEQGYVVLCPNPSGSTGFGLEVMASVQGDWGGRAYFDLVKAIEHVEKTYDYVDCSRIVAGGGSYGGYMANWIAGQPLAKRLKAIISHDGIFHASSMLASDFISGLDEDVGSKLWEDTKPWEKWSPANYTKNWETPMLIIHSEKDFRCPINEGLAAFGVCQAKGIPSRFLWYPDENHWVLGRENSLHWQKTVLGWCNHYVGITDGVKLPEANCEAKFDEEDSDDSDDNDEGQKGGK